MLVQPVRIYIVGAGVIARSHARAASKLPAPDGVSLAVADPDSAALADFAAEFPDARTVNDAGAMLAEPAAADDIVVVATPPHTHAELTCQALATGRHVLCEKPLAMDRVEALMMLEAARTNRRLLGCCSCRFLGVPTTEEAKRLLASGVLGRPYHVSFIYRAQRSRSGIEYQPESRWFLDRARSGGGVLMDLGPYDFTLLSDMLAPTRVDVLSAWMAQPTTDVDPELPTTFDVEMHVGASLLYHLPDGATLPVTYERASCTHGEERSLLQIEGTRGAVRWDWLMWKREGEITRSYDEDGQLRERTDALHRGEMNHFERPLQYFYQRCQGNDAPIAANEQAVFNFSIIRAIYDCAALGRPQEVTWSSFGD